MSYLCTVGVFSADSSLWESSSIDAGSDDIHSVSSVDLRHTYVIYVGYVLSHGANV